MDGKFSPAVAKQLKTYVYRLIDPRNGETFYVGKGKGNRVFAHIATAKGLEGDELDNKLDRIRKIRLLGLSVVHVIHRHGLDDKTAFEVESALMDAYPGLSNIAGGVGGNDFGAMHAHEIVQRYEAPVAKFVHRAMLITVNRSALETSLYEATRYAWRVSLGNAQQAEVVLPTVQGLIVGAYVNARWMSAVPANFPGRDPVPGRYGFVADEAPPMIARLYVNKRVPDEFRRKGAANPIKYTWK